MSLVHGAVQERVPNEGWNTPRFEQVVSYSCWRTPAYLVDYFLEDYITRHTGPHSLQHLRSMGSAA